MAESYDIFISYAHRNARWVFDRLYKPLLERTRREDQERPRIFFDDSREDGIPAGRGWVKSLVEAIGSCRRFVPVYSEFYFQQEFCEFELRHAMKRDFLGNHGIIIPLQIDSVPVPEEFSLIQSVSTSKHADWFDRLCDALELDARFEQLYLNFISQPCDVQVNQTLPPVRLRVCDCSGTIQSVSDVISLRAENGTLQGETSRAADGGEVEFNNLSLGEPCSSTRLIAEGAGLAPCYSTEFTLVPTTETVAREEETTASAVDDTLSVRGFPVFFARDSALAVVGQEGVSAFDVTTRRPLLERPLPFEGRLRFIRQGDEAIVLCNWEGRVYVLGLDGCTKVMDFCSQTRTVNVVGDVATVGGDVYIGLWSGEVFRLSRNPNDPPPAAPIVHHPMGIQALTVTGSDIAVVDLSGGLTIYRNREVVRSETIEPRVYLLRSYPHHLIAVGLDSMYQIPLDGSRMLTEDSLVHRSAAVYGECAIPVVIDEQGRGVRIDHELRSKGAFHTAAGARPTSADDGGTWSVFSNSDGTHMLLSRNAQSLQSRVIHSHNGPLAINRRGDSLAVDEPSGIRLIHPSELEVTERV